MVERQTSINFDIENNSLQIKTNSLVGSNEVVIVSFRTAQGGWYGGVEIKHEATPKYWIRYCSPSGGFLDFLPTVPSDTVKVWQITLTKTSQVRLVIHCNSVELLDFVVSASTCDSERYDSTKWDPNLTLTAIYFQPSDSASDYYRSGERHLQSFSGIIILTYSYLKLMMFS